jgi:hypothetical protein
MAMKRLVYSSLLILAISGFAACSEYNYYTAGLNKTNLSQYHTFAWMPVVNLNKQKSTSADDSVAYIKIKTATTKALISKGLKLQDKNPDLLVSYSAVVGRGVKTTYYYSYPYYGGFYPGFYGGWGYGGWGWGVGFGWGWGGYRPYWGFPYYYGYPYYGGYYGPAGVERYHYKEGTLIIDLVDRSTKKVIWRGFGVGDVHKDPQKNIEDLPKVVNGIIEQLQLTPQIRS